MSSLSTLTIAPVSGGYLIGVIGRGTLALSPTFKALVEERLEDPQVSVLVDLTACEYLDSSFLGSLVALDRRFGLKDQPRFRLVASLETRHKLLHCAPLEDLFHFMDTPPLLLGEPETVTAVAYGRDDLGQHVAEAHRSLADLGGPNALNFRRIADQLRNDLE